MTYNVFGGTLNPAQQLYTVNYYSSQLLGTRIAYTLYAVILLADHFIVIFAAV